MSFKIVQFASILIVGAFAQAANAEVSILPRFDDRSISPGRLIPFELTGLSTEDSTATISASVLNSGEVDCRVMRDPFLPKIFLLKCKAEADVTLQIKIKSATQSKTLNYVGIRVLHPTNMVPIPPIEGEGGGPTYSTEVLRGQVTYTTRCLRCHGVGDKAGYTAEQITAATFRRAQMYSLQGVLSAAELQELEAYLASGLMRP